MADAPMIEPKAVAPETTETPTPDPEAPPAEPTESEGSGSKLPDALLQVPAMQALMAGNPAAVSAHIEEFASNPVAKLVVQNKDGLLKAGIGFYRSMNGGLGVLFNQFHIHGDEIQAADKAGKLEMIAPSFDTVNQAVQQSGMANPVLTKKQPPTTFKTAPIKSPAQFANTPAPAAPTANVGMASASVPKKLTTQRVKNLSPGGPTTGQEPGAGRLLNQILTPVV